MKYVIQFRLVAIFAILLALITLPGCATGGGGSNSARNEATLNLAIGVASDAAVLVLQKNPKAIPVLKSVSLGIDTVLTGQSLTPQQVKSFVDALDKGANLTPPERVVIGRAIQRVHELLTGYFGTSTLDVTNPQVRAALVKIQRAIDDTLALNAVLMTPEA